MSQLQSMLNMNEQIVNISVFGEFNVKLARDFRSCYEDGEDINQYIIDMSHVIYIDSSGIGMLIVMVEELKSRNLSIQIKLVHVNQEMKALFKCIHIEQLCPKLIIE